MRRTVLAESNGCAMVLGAPPEIEAGSLSQILRSCLSTGAEKLERS